MEQGGSVTEKERKWSSYHLVWSEFIRWLWSRRGPGGVESWRRPPLPDLQPSRDGVGEVNMSVVEVSSQSVAAFQNIDGDYYTGPVLDIPPVARGAGAPLMSGAVV